MLKLTALPTVMSHPTPSYEIGQQILQLTRTSPDSQTLLSEIAGVLRNVLAGGTCLIVAGTNPQEEIQMACCREGQTLRLSPVTTYQVLSDPLVKKIIAERESKPLAFNDLQSLPALFPASSLPEILSVRSLIGIATHFRNEPNGLLLVGDFQSRRWTAAEKDLLQGAADSAAVAFSLIRLQEQNSRNSTLNPSYPDSSLAMEGHPLLKIWYEATRRQTNEFINNIITTLSDRARNPLASMKLAIQLLGMPNLPPQLQAQYLDILHQEWQRLHDFHAKILAFKPLKAQELTFNPRSVQLESLIDELAQIYEARWQQDALSLTLDINIQHAADSPLTLNTDPDRLGDILAELLNNAGKFSLPNSTVCLEAVRQEIPKPQVMLTLTNQSVCLSPKDLKYLFDPFYREQAVVDSGIPGIGLGLTIAKGLAEMLGGTLAVSCTPLPGAESCMIAFKLAFPSSRPQQKI
jgi:signal transduction histidine kinase